MPKCAKYDEICNFSAFDEIIDDVVITGVLCNVVTSQSGEHILRNGGSCGGG